MLSKLVNKYVLFVEYKALEDNKVPNQILGNYILENSESHP